MAGMDLKDDQARLTSMSNKGCTPSMCIFGRLKNEMYYNRT